MHAFHSHAGRGLIALGLLSFALSSCADLSRSSASSASFASAMYSLGSSSDMWAGTFLPYQEDVRSLTVAAVEAGVGADDLLRQVGRVAEQYGVTDWEAEPVTYYAMGQGLSLSELDASGAHAYARELAGDDADAFRALVEGYES